MSRALVFSFCVAVAAMAAACSPGQEGSRDAADDVPFFDSPADSSDMPVTSAKVGRFALGGTHSCWLAEDSVVYCWGSNNRGQLGDGSEIEHAMPTAVLDLDNPISIDGRGAQNCAVMGNDEVRCWGSNSYDQLGGDTNADFRSTPVTVRDIDDGETVAVGALHACALRTGGAVWCWGNNLSGALGRGTQGAPEKPAAVSTLADATGLAAGSSFGCALRGDQSVMCWGKNTNAQVGDGSTMDRLAPVAVVGLPGAATMVTAGDAHACALVAGDVYCWGSNKFGQVGSGAASDTDVPAPTKVVGIDGDAIAVDAGSQTTCALRGTGSLACWGSNASKQLGDVVDAFRPSASDMPGVAGVEFFGVGTNHVCVATVGHVYCWGSNAQGQLGVMTEETEIPTPQNVPLPGPT